MLLQASRRASVLLGKDSLKTLLEGSNTILPKDIPSLLVCALYGISCYVSPLNYSVFFVICLHFMVSLHYSLQTLHERLNVNVLRPLMLRCQCASTELLVGSMQTASGSLCSPFQCWNSGALEMLKNTSMPNYNG